jgi:predicted metal-binding membrane protein
MTALKAGLARAPLRLQSIRSLDHAVLVILGVSTLGWIAILWRDVSAGRDLEPVARAALVTTSWVDVAVAAGGGITAMMLPLALPGTRHVIASTFRAQRTLAAAAFLASFVLTWLAFALLASLLIVSAARLGVPSEPRALLITALMGTAAWQVVPWKRTALRDCHLALPLPPRGWRSSAGSLRFGAVVAVRCVASCGGLMLPMLVGGSAHLLFGFLGTAAALGERRLAILRRMPWLVGGGALGLAAFIAIIGPDPGRSAVSWLCDVALPR